MEAMRAAGGNTIVLTGDTHIAWANEVSDAHGRVAVELGATSVTSPSEAAYFSPFGVDFGAGVRARNPHIKFTDPMHHGFVLLSLSKEQALAEFFSVSTITSKDFTVERTAAFTVAPEAGPGIGALTPAE